MRFLTIFFLLLMYHNTSAMSLLQTRDCDTILFKNGRVFYAYVLDTLSKNIRYWDYGESFDKPVKVYPLKRIDSIKKGKVSGVQTELSKRLPGHNSKKQFSLEIFIVNFAVFASYGAILILLIAILQQSLFLFFLFALLLFLGTLFSSMSFLKSKDDPTKFKIFRRARSGFYALIGIGLFTAFMINRFVFFNY
jgi:hypothetical protein